MFVLDANVMKAFDDDLLHQAGPSYEGVRALLAEDCFAYSNRMEHEWLSCTSNLFREWFNQEVQADRLRLTNGLVNPATKRKLRTKYGLGDARDQEYIWVANATERKSLVSNDIDHYDPTLKEATSDAKARCKLKRSGKLCKFLVKELGVTVGMLDFHVASLTAT